MQSETEKEGGSLPAKQHLVELLCLTFGHSRMYPVFLNIYGLCDQIVRSVIDLCKASDGVSTLKELWILGKLIYVLRHQMLVTPLLIHLVIASHCYQFIYQIVISNFR